MKKSIVLMASALFALSAGKCDDETSAAKGSKGGACYTNMTCDQGLVCIDETECVPDTSSGGGDGDTDSDADGDGDGDAVTLEDTIEETSEILCDRLITCFGDDNVADDCEDELEDAFTNEGCKNFDAEQADPCLDCLEDDLDCTEVQAIILYGYPLNTYCNVCDLMCD